MDYTCLVKMPGSNPMSNANGPIQPAPNLSGFGRTVA